MSIFDKKPNILSFIDGNNVLLLYDEKKITWSPLKFSEDIVLMHDVTFLTFFSHTRMSGIPCCRQQNVLSNDLNQVLAKSSFLEANLSFTLHIKVTLHFYCIIMKLELYT